ncbi:MAG: TIGR03905 family TSCPD domain-containing protein [Clostridium sp.]|nr:TIGR03905 family TSCPD domain-containing protein [Clostridium sp.]MDY3827916.1 TIGR03905 family TSCPD domain-containing protein [Clostridium sp.]
MQYITKGTCSTEINFEVENNKITEISFTGGCSGNLQGICSLVKGMNIDDVISKLEGIKCGYKSTSCPDQLAKALKEVKGSR